MGISNKDLSNLTYLWSIIATIVNIFLIILLVLLTRIKHSSYLELINYKKGETKIKDVIIVSLIVISLGMGGMYLSGLIFYQKFPYLAPDMVSPISLWIAIINIPLLPITTALAEDGLYLGCGVNQINNRYLKIIIPGFFFALQHSFIPLLLDIKFIGYRFFSFLPLTLLLAYIYDKKKNPLPIMIAHAIIDLFTVISILIFSINPEWYSQLV
jgi:membrane protease YdiL (CAAX protease family)